MATTQKKTAIKTASKASNAGKKTVSAKGKTVKTAKEAPKAAKKTDKKAVAKVVVPSKKAVKKESPKKVTTTKTAKTVTKNTKTNAPVKKAPVKKAVAPAKKVAAKKAPVKKAAAKKVAVKQAPKKQAAVKKTAPVKKAAAKAAPVKKVAAAPKTAAKKTTAVKKTAVSTKSTATAKPPVKQAAAKNTVPKTAAAEKRKPSLPAKKIVKTAPVKPGVSIAAMPARTPARSVPREDNKPPIVIARRRPESKQVKKEEAGKTMINYQPDYTRSILDQPTQHTGPVYRYSDEELSEFRELIMMRLENARKELSYLQGLITRKDEAGTEDTENRYMNMEDGSGAMEREQLAQLASRQIQFINHLEKALMRIENKTYGICRVTGKLIDKARLRAVPHATLSIEAKRMMNNSK